MPIKILNEDTSSNFQGFTRISTIEEQEEEQIKLKFCGKDTESIEEWVPSNLSQSDESTTKSSARKQI